MLIKIVIVALRYCLSKARNKNGITIVKWVYNASITATFWQIFVILGPILPEISAISQADLSHLGQNTVKLYYS